jgi:hypothetical protein
MFYITFGIGFTCAYLDPAVLHEAVRNILIISLVTLSNHPDMC